jgi:hypothetical protein
VGDEDDAEAELGLELLDLHHQRALRDDVKRRCWLVHDHQVGCEEQGHGDHCPLAHAARELVRIAAQMLRVDSDHLEHVRRPVGDLGLRLHAMGPHRVGELRSDRLHRVERVHRALHDDRQVLPAHGGQLGVGHPHHADALEDHAAAHDAGRRAQQLGNGEKQG